MSSSVTVPKEIFVIEGRVCATTVSVLKAGQEAIASKVIENERWIKVAYLILTLVLPRGWLQPPYGFLQSSSKGGV